MTSQDTPDGTLVEQVDPATGYAAASAELDTILATLERDDVDVDELATLVARAAALVEHCRARISSAKMQLKKFERPDQSTAA